jgi:pimeloyl-[acyl-carrier protein] methyl ester esterase
VAVLNGGLTILSDDDLRDRLTAITLPFLRMYGALDGLVPRRIVQQLDPLLPTSPSVVTDKAAHAPFISHPDAFCQHIVSFISKLDR